MAARTTQMTTQAKGLRISLFSKLIFRSRLNTNEKKVYGDGKKIRTLLTNPQEVPSSVTVEGRDIAEECDPIPDLPLLTYPQEVPSPDTVEGRDIADESHPESPKDTGHISCHGEVVGATRQTKKRVFLQVASIDDPEGRHPKTPRAETSTDVHSRSRFGPDPRPGESNFLVGGDSNTPPLPYPAWHRPSWFRGWTVMVHDVLLRVDHDVSGNGNCLFNCFTNNVEEGRELRQECRRWLADLPNSADFVRWSSDPERLISVLLDCLAVDGRPVHVVTALVVAAMKREHVIVVNSFGHVLVNSRWSPTGDFWTEPCPTSVLLFHQYGSPKEIVANHFCPLFNLEGRLGPLLEAAPTDTEKSLWAVLQFDLDESVPNPNVTYYQVVSDAIAATIDLGGFIPVDGVSDSASSAVRDDCDAPLVLTIPDGDPEPPAVLCEHAAGRVPFVRDPNRPLSHCPFCGHSWRSAKPVQSLTKHLENFHWEVLPSAPMQFQRALSAESRGPCFCCKKFRSLKARHTCKSPVSPGEGPHLGQEALWSVPIESTLPRELLEDEPIPPLSEILLVRFRTLQEIPGHLRGVIARSWTRAGEHVLDSNSTSAWTEFLLLPSVLLASDGIDRSTLTETVRARAENSFQACLRMVLQLPPPVPRTPDPVKCAKAWASRGRPGKALSALMSSRVADFSPRSERVLREKHPLAQAAPEPSPPPNWPKFGPFSKDMVWDAILDFDRFTAAGPSGLRAAWLVDLVKADETGDLLRVLTKLLRLLLNGEVPAEVGHALSSAALHALEKKDLLEDGLVDLRPIAVGEILRRLCSKLACKIVVPKVPLAPHQVGVGVQSGTEVVVHATRALLAANPDLVLVQVDYHNAFNRISRAAFFREVRHLCPELLRWVHLCYGTHPDLYWNTLRFTSCEGVQQGDPLGPFLFAIALHPLVQAIQEFLVRECSPGFLHAWFLDDGNIALPLHLVVPLFDLIQRAEWRDAGLHVNLGKTKIYHPRLAPQIYTRSGKQWIDVGPYTVRASAEGTVLLGSAIGSSSFINGHAQACLDTMEEIHRKIRELDDLHVEGYVFKFCSGYCRINHLLRTTPPDELDSFLVRYRSICSKMMCHLLGAPSLPPNVSSQLALRPRLGGFGLRWTLAHCRAAFFASQVASRKSVKKLLPTDVVFLDSETTEYLALREECPDLPSFNLLAGMKDGLQHSLSHRLDTAAAALLLESFDAGTDDGRHHRARLTGISQDYASAWLACPPRKSEHRSSLEYQVLLRDHVGLPVLPDDATCSCGKATDKFGGHCMGCMKTGNVTRRHTGVVRTSSSLLSMAGISNRVEVGGHLVGTKARIADIATYNPAEHAYDVTIGSSLTSQRMGGPALTKGAVAAEAHKKKLAARNAIEDSMGQTVVKITAGSIPFTPLAFDHFGGMTQTTVDFYRLIARGISRRLAMQYSVAMGYVMQRVSMTMQCGKLLCLRPALSRAIWSRSTPNTEVDSKVYFPREDWE